MELIADTSNGGKLIKMMRGQANTPELITPSDLEVIAFIAQNHEIMEQAERMAGKQFTSEQRFGKNISSQSGTNNQRFN